MAAAILVQCRCEAVAGRVFIAAAWGRGVGSAGAAVIGVAVTGVAAIGAAAVTGVATIGGVIGIIITIITITILSSSADSAFRSTGIGTPGVIPTDTVMVTVIAIRLAVVLSGVCFCD